MKKQSERKEIRESHTIFIRKSGEFIPVTKEVFKNHYRTVDAFRRKMQRHGECFCPKDEQLKCDTDCAICPYRIKAKELSLDYDSWEEDDERWVEDFANSSPSPEDFFCEKDEIRSILSRIEELMPEAIEIGKRRLAGLTDTRIEEEIGVGRKTSNYRIMRLRRILEEEFPDYF